MNKEQELIRVMLQESLDSLHNVIKERPISRSKTIMAYGQASSIFILAKEADLLTPEVNKTVSEILNLTAELCDFKPIW